MCKLEPMTKTDFAWYRMDTSHNLMVINIAMFFDKPLNIDTLKKNVNERLPPYRRFSQRVVITNRQAYWQDVANFEYSDHIDYFKLAKNTKQQVLQQLSHVAQLPLPKNQPLWRMTVLENSDGHFTVLFRVHHCLADGVAVMHLIEVLTDPAENVAEENRRFFSQKSQQETSPAFALLSQTAHIASVAWEMLKLSLMFSDAPSPLKKKSLAAKQLCCSESLSVAEVKEVSKHYDATINDVLCATIAGGLHDYFAEQGHTVRGGKIRAAVAVNLRDKIRAQTLGNEFGLVALRMNINLATPLTRLQQIKIRMGQLKNSRQAYTTEPVLQLMGYLPLTLQRFVINWLMNKYSLVISNLEGPNMTRSLAGAKMQELIFWVPQAGKIGVGISIISYAGKICFGLFADEKRICQPERLMRQCCEQFELLKQIRTKDLKDKSTFS